MRKVGLLLLVGSVLMTLLTLTLWLTGLALGVGGGLIHLLLVVSITVGPVGFVTGLVLLLIEGRGGARSARDGSEARGGRP
jgi:hypothetical protein